VSAAPDVAGSGSRRILANTVWRAAADVGGKLISLALFVVLARELGEHGFGVFVLGFTVASILTVFASFGQDPVLTREVARDRKRLDAYFSNTIGLKLSLALPVLLVAAAAAGALGTAPETRWTILILGVALIVEQLSSTCFAVYQAFEQLVYVPIVILAQRALTVTASVAALLAGAGVVAVAAIYLVGAAAAFALACALLRGRVARPSLDVTPRGWPALFAAAAPVGVATVLALLLFRADMAILALFEPESVVGNYGAAFRVFESTLFVSWAVTTAVFPVLARLTASSRPSLGEVFDGALKLVVALTLPISVLTVVLAEPMIHLVYGSAFEDAVVPLQLLGPAIVLYSVAFLAGSMLVAQNRQRSTAVVYGVLAVANMAASIVLIPVLSLDGAAVAALATQLGLAVALVVLATRASGSICWSRILVGPAAASALLALTAYALRGHFAAALLAATAVYAVSLTALEFRAHPEDARRIRSFVRQSRAAGAASR
jgi:O-antigen/teichoic acid export membrane protein